MKGTVGIAELKAHLSEYLRAVRKGKEVVIKDRETPIARLVPHEGGREPLITRPATKPMAEIDRLFDAKPRKPLVRTKDLEKAIRETKMDVYDKWMASKRTSTRQ